MTDGLTDKDRSGIRSVLEANSKIRRALIFGSRAMGTFRGASDVDLALEGDDIGLQDLVAIKAQIGKLNLPVEVDLVIRAKINNPELEQHIKTYGRAWYQKKPRSQSLAGEWRETVLEELIEAGEAHLQTGPFGTALKAAEYTTEGVPLISVGEIRQGHFEVSDKTPRVSKETTQRLPKFVLEIGDIVFGRKGGIDRNAIVHQPQQGWFLGSDGIRLRLSDKYNSLFFSYQMRSPATRAWLSQNSEGTTMPSLNQEILGRIPIIIPPFPEQKAIAHILGTLDDKIELNRRMNATLEAMAQALFRSWFVDFDPVRAKRDERLPISLNATTAALFPAHFKDSEIGRIPHGWETIPLYNTARFINGAAFKSEDFCAPGLGQPVVKIAELKEGISTQTKWSKRQASPDQLIDTGDLLYSWSGSPDTSLDAFLWTKGSGLLNQHIFKVVARTTAQKRFVYYLLKYLRPVLVETARDKQTTGLGHVTVADMKRLRVCQPDTKVLSAFDEIVGPIFDKAFANTLENQALAALRDTLLLKLLNGKVDVTAVGVPTEVAA